MVDLTPTSWIDGVQTYAAGLATMVGDQGVVIFRTLIIGLVGWGALSLMEVRSELLVVRTRQEDVLRRLAESDARISAGTDDRWRRRDHDAFASQLGARLDLIEGRVDAQGRLIATVIAKQK